MSLVTLKRYLVKTDDFSGFRKIIALLMDGIANHGVCVDADELENFRSEMQRIRAQADSECSLDQLFVAAGATVQGLDSYNSRTSRLIRRQSLEMQNMISMMAQTIISIGSGCERSDGALRSIQHELEQAGAIEDVQQLKQRLGTCLEQVRSESERQRTDAAAAILALQTSVQAAQTSSVSSPELDFVTMLPKESAAKIAFIDAVKTGGRKYIVTMVIDRLHAINARFGHEVGDQLLRTWQAHIESTLIAQGDLLFRWKGPTLVALIARPDTIDRIRNGLKGVLDRKIEKEFDVGGRSALIPLSVAWSVIAAIPPATNLPVFIDKFVATRIPKDYL